MRNPVQRVAAIHDLSGFGRTSLTVAIPIFSALGIQVCPLPTAVLSTHTSDFDDFCFVDLSGPMRDFLAHWKKLGLQFDAVYSGFLGSPEQAEIVADCIENCLMPGGLAVIDPVLGDNGKLDPTMSMEMVERQRWLISKAHCITPNLTEAALLLDEPFPWEAVGKLDHKNSTYAPGLEENKLKDWLYRLAGLGPEISIITSVPVAGSKGQSAVVAYDKSNHRFWKVNCEYIPAFYPGTGDTFTSVLTGSLMQGDSLPIAMDRAVQFVTMGIRATFGYNIPHREGLLLERVLNALHAPVTSSSYELLEEKDDD